MRVRTKHARAIRTKTVRVPAGVRVQPPQHAHEALLLLETLAAPAIVRDVEQLLARGFYWDEAALAFDEDGHETGTVWELRYRDKPAGLLVSHAGGSYAFTIHDLFVEMFDKYFNKGMLVRKAGG